jgi:hypothetical protein
MKDRQREAAYVAKTIAAFLDGTGGERDWDVFTSFRLHDRTLDGIRRRALTVDLPVDDDGEATLFGLKAEAEQVIASAR